MVFNLYFEITGANLTKNIDYFFLKYTYTQQIKFKEAPSSTEAESLTYFA